MGFTFDDTDTRDVANPLLLMRELIDKDLHNAERIFPYLGGEEVNDDPCQQHHRYTINFGEFPLRRTQLSSTWSEADEQQREAWLSNGIVPLDYPDPVASDWPDLLRVIEEKVKPMRESSRGRAEAERLASGWWLFNRSRPELFDALARIRRAAVISEVSPQFSIAFAPSNCVFAQTLKVFTIDSYQAFSVLQSRPHEFWARLFGSSMKDDLRYTPTDCFETFSFPNEFESNAALEQAGREYYEFRAALMVCNNEGLTKTYNRFHDPDERQADILRLRELHAAMDCAVLEAYGWNDLAARAKCEFILDYEDEEDGSEGPRRRKKPWRYRWHDEIRDEMLARLLALNAERAEDERLAREAADAQETKTSKRKSRKGSSRSGAPANQTGFEFKDP
jgi:hypothetical protein